MMPGSWAEYTHAVKRAILSPAFQRGANVAAFGKAGGDDDVLDAAAALTVR